MLQENVTTQNVTYASISNGQIVVRSTQDDTKAIKRINKLGNEVWERFYKSIAGKINTIDIYENKFEEKEIRVGILGTEGQIGVLTVKWDSSYGRDFLNQIFNIDLSRMVNMNPWQKQFEDGTKRSKLYLSYADGDKAKVEYKAIEGCPEVKFAQVKGKTVVDNISKAEQDAFLEEKLQEFINTNNLIYVKSEPQQALQEEDFAPEIEGQKIVKPGSKAAQKALENSADDDFFEDF